MGNVSFPSMGSLGTNKANKNDKKARKAATMNTIVGETSHKRPNKTGRNMAAI